MQLDHDWKRTAAAGNEQSRQQGSFTVSEIFRVLYVNVIGGLRANDQF